MSTRSLRSTGSRTKAANSEAMSRSFVTDSRMVRVHTATTDSKLSETMPLAR